jgi:hypothetical protein
MRKLAVSSALLVFLLALGCGGIKVVDEVSKGSAKGYVKFYYLPDEGRNPINVSILSTDKVDVPPDFNRNILTGKVPGWTIEGDITSEVLGRRSKETGILVAKPPGMYIFAIEVGTIPRKYYKILVQENMVAPVKFKFWSISRTETSGSTVITTTSYLRYSVEITFEEPFPFPANSIK